MLTCFSTKINNANRKHVWASLSVLRIHLGLVSVRNSGRNLQLIRQKKLGIVCLNGELVPPQSGTYKKTKTKKQNTPHTTCMEDPSLIKSLFNFSYLIPSTHPVSVSPLRSCLGAAIRSKRRGLLRSNCWQIISWKGWGGQGLRFF